MLRPITTLTVPPLLSVLTDPPIAALTSVFVCSMRFREHTRGRFLVGFPWLIALTTYTVSWGWSLIRPDTLYWDDWAYIFNQPKSYLSEIFSKTGMPPWRALIDQELLGVGYWTIRWLTFIMFFMAGMFLFETLKKMPFISLTQSQSIVLLFLIVPLNHARIALVMFGYTTSYFLFFLAWMLLVKYSSSISFFFACVFFMWSFMTHSFIFFYVLPVLHFIYLNHKQLGRKKLDMKVLASVCVTLGLPVLYYFLRSKFWRPDASYLWYHTIYLRAVFVSIGYLLPFIVSAIGIVLWARRGKRITLKVQMLTSGFLAFGIGVCPYISSGNLDSKMIFFFWELGWTSRHQLLMPLGASIIGVSIVYYVSENKPQTILALVSAVLVSLNIFWGIGSYVDSVKRDRLEELFAAEIISTSALNFVFVDETQHLNFRGDGYRRYEVAGLLSKAGLVSVPIFEDECSGKSDQIEVTVRSDRGLLEAFFSRNLGLRLEINPCKSS